MTGKNGNRKGKELLAAQEFAEQGYKIAVAGQPKEINAVCRLVEVL